MFNIDHKDYSEYDEGAKLFGVTFQGYRTCFLCNTPIHQQDNYVHWHGTTDNPDGTLEATNIHLHPECAKTLGTHLIKDGFCADDKKYRWPDKVSY